MTDGVNPVAGAFVAATGAEGQATAVTDADGHYSVDQLPEGDYTVAVQASGFTVGTEAVAVAGNAAVDASFALRSSGATFSSLPFYGGQIEHLFSGGVPGLFYAATGAIPQIFRTVDYGGHWTPVSTQYDDPANGLDKWTLQPGNRVAVSGHPGEIALRMNASVYYSRDFGATWQALPEQFPLNGSGPHEVFWGQAGDSSVLLVRDGTQSWRADMTQASPHLVRMTAGYGASTDVVTVADGVGAPWVAALSTSGTLTIYRLIADEPATPEGSPLTGFPNGSNLLVLSGTSTAQTPPSAVFTHGSGGDVVIALKDAEDSVFTAARRSAPYPMPSECAAGTDSFIAPASLAPTSGGARAFGTMGFCAVQDEAGTLTARQMWGGANNIAYDAGYGADGDLVILANGNRGIAKSASVDGHGVPIFPSDQDATAGAGPNSGGDSVDGINVPVVADTAYGPSANNIATVLAAGGLGYASDDGGRTSHIAVRSGGSAVAWWQGATHSWLMFGTGGQGTLLTAIPDWSASSPTLDQPNLVDVQASDLGFPDPDRNGLSITALAGIPDSDTVFVGVGKGGDWSPEEEATSGALARVTLTAVPRPSASVVTPLGGTAFDHAAVRSLAYCPSTAAGAPDTLFVGLDKRTSGGVVTVTSASGDTPQVGLPVGTQYPVRKLAVDCAAGTVWAATGYQPASGGDGGGALLRSADVGSSFAAVPVTFANLDSRTILHFTALALNAADPSELLLSANMEGYLLRSTDSGASWTALNNPAAAGRNFSTQGILDLEMPAAAPPSARGGWRPASAAIAGYQNSSLVATGSGAFSAARSTSSTGVYLASSGDDGWTTAARVHGTGGSASQPALAVDASGATTVVYRGAGGLYVSAKPSGGAWALPRKLAGTGSRDVTPVLRAGHDGTLYLAFARSGSGAGAYVAVKPAGGAWTPPVRRSTAAGDSVPSLAVDGLGKLHLAYRRAAAPAGIYYLTNQSGRWSSPVRVTGTSAQDDAPCLAAASISVHLAFSRSRVGIFTAVKPRAQARHRRAGRPRRRTQRRLSSSTRMDTTTWSSAATLAPKACTSPPTGPAGGA